MSSTNRGAIRNENDYYATPRPAIESFLNIFELQPGNILEPCAGRGAISSVIHERYPNAYLMQIDINHDFDGYMANYGHFDIRDFRKWKPDQHDQQHFRTIITNPPYSIAQEVIEHCFELAIPSTEIIMLLRLGFLGSKKRSDFWKKHPVTQIYPLSQRPSFTGDGRDSTDYAWYVWSNRREPLIRPI
jgi:hypothetical protein